MSLAISTLLVLIASASAQTYKSSFTQYGGCNSVTTACGFYDSSGYNAAASQNLFGAAPGQGAGPACGTCWLLTPQTESDGSPIYGANNITVKVNNLCPIDGNLPCNQTDLSGDSVNAMGATVNFDLCMDDGAATQFYGAAGSNGIHLAVGTAMKVSCWFGSIFSSDLDNDNFIRNPGSRNESTELIVGDDFDYDDFAHVVVGQCRHQLWLQFLDNWPTFIFSDDSDNDNFFNASSGSTEPVRAVWRRHIGWVDGLPANGDWFAAELLLFVVYTFSGMSWAVATESGRVLRVCKELAESVLIILLNMINVGWIVLGELFV
ncbi:hypothetical protein MMC13_005091 [Lambiella insularis]|nr:hypothetical protein [Lambiella insularis]